LIELVAEQAHYSVDFGDRDGGIGEKGAFHSQGLVIGAMADRPPGGRRGRLLPVATRSMRRRAVAGSLVSACFCLRTRHASGMAEADRGSDPITATDSATVLGGVVRLSQAARVDAR